jgi:hypothetical protein
MASAVVVLGTAFALAVASAAVTSPPVYKQCDPKWGNDTMGVVGNGHRSTICQSSKIVSHFHPPCTAPMHSHFTHHPIYAPTHIAVHAVAMGTFTPAVATGVFTFDRGVSTAGCWWPVTRTIDLRHHRSIPHTAELKLLMPLHFPCTSS